LTHFRLGLSLVSGHFRENLCRKIAKTGKPLVSLFSGKDFPENDR